MKFLIQRVLEADVEVDGHVVGSIGKGLLVFIGISDTDTKEIADKYLNKLMKLRIFEDEAGKTNLSLADVSGEVLLISQFTLYANCKDGNRPSFTGAGKPDMAKELYEYILTKSAELGMKTGAGIFGADMKVKLINDGPFTIILDEGNIKL